MCWAFWGGIYFLFVLWVSLCVSLHHRHSANIENYYDIAWTYVTLAVGILSLIYPLVLGLRESLTNRLFDVYEKLKDKIEEEEAKRKEDAKSKEDDPRLVAFKKDCYEPLQAFRENIFERQLPFLASFSLLSVIRVLFCLMRIGPLSVEHQIMEPQFYVLAYLLWTLWFTSTVLRFKPLAAIENVEAKLLELPSFESKFAKQEDKSL